MYCVCWLDSLVAWFVILYSIVLLFTVYYLLPGCWVLCCVCTFVCSWISMLFGLLSVVGCFVACCFVWWFGIWLSCVDCGFGVEWLFVVLIVVCTL